MNSSPINSPVRKKDLTNSSVGKNDSIYVKLHRVKKGLLSQSPSFGNGTVKKKAIPEEEKRIRPTLEK